MKNFTIALMAVLITTRVFSQSPVTVVSPNGGENWVTGCPSMIQWMTSNTMVPVKIELFKNSAFYMTICNQVPAGTNTFTWFPPFSVIPGSDYKVKITILTSSAGFDFSDNDFTISLGSLTVGSPNGGENWVKGTIHPIIWTGNICTNVRIELWKGGLFHSVIAQSVPPNSPFTWMVPDIASLVPGDDYKVKILSLANSGGTTSMVYDFSDNNFTISGGQNTGQVTVIAPNGGENWIIGCPGLIQWITTATTGPVRIELFKNDLFYMTICAQTPPGVSTFSWIPPFSVVPGNTFKVRVSSLTNPAGFDFSDGNFSISLGSITVVSPNGGETWVKGTMHPILWTDNLCGNVRIELWKGGVFNSVIAQSVPSNGTFNWMVPNTTTLVPGNDYKVKIMSLFNNTGTTSMVFDYSDNDFTISEGQITGQITVVAPNGGENWITGCPVLIQWISPAAVWPVKIELFKNDLYYMTICPQVPAGMSSFSWVPPFFVVPGNDYKVKVSSLISPSGFDFSDGNFSISPGSITVVSPNGGETWIKGTMHPILWTDNICGNVRIELWKGGVFKSVIAQSVPSTGTFNWVVPNTTTMVPGIDYKVKIMSLFNNTGTASVVFDFSDNDFTIAEGQNTGQITVIAPNGGESWIVGCPGFIQWVTSSTTGPVKIELFKSDLFYMTICPQVPGGMNSFTWIPPSSVIPGSDFKVKVSSLTNIAGFDFSDDFFSITMGSITVVTPNGGEAWDKGTMHPVLWSDNLCGNVRIELWKGGIFNSVIAHSVPSNGTFNWLIPNTTTLIPGNDYKIKIMSMFNSSGTASLVYDYSDNDFSITGNSPPLISTMTGKITVYPNPFSDLLHINFQEASQMPLILEILDISGDVLLSRSTGAIPAAYTYDLNTTGIPAGKYLLVVKNGNSVVSRHHVLSAR